MNAAIRLAGPLDLDAIISLLGSEALPTSDLTAESLSNFFIAEVDGDIIGCIGAELFADLALLRSLVVSAAGRGFGLGGRLVAVLEGHLVELGCADLWLLTMDADGFFSSLGFEAEPRDRAPNSIRATAEFSSLCPGDAVLMRKPIGPA